MGAPGQVARSLWAGKGGGGGGGGGGLPRNWQSDLKAIASRGSDGAELFGFTRQQTKALELDAIQVCRRLDEVLADFLTPKKRLADGPSDEWAAGSYWKGAVQSLHRHHTLKASNLRVGR